MTQMYDISGPVVDFDAQFVADLEQEIMHPGPQLRNFVLLQAQQQQRMSDLQQQINSQQDEARSAAGTAAQADQHHLTLKLQLSRERAERRQVSSATQNQQWQESQKAAEPLARFEANVHAARDTSSQRRIAVRKRHVKQRVSDLGAVRANSFVTAAFRDHAARLGILNMKLRKGMNTTSYHLMPRCVLRHGNSRPVPSRTNSFVSKVS